MNVDSSSTIVSTRYTCLTCRIEFKSPVDQSVHYRSDWHRYNLKRKCVGLSPIDGETFIKKIAEAKAAESTKKEPEKSYCNECRKLYSTKNAYNNHLTSKRHKENVKNNLSKPAEEKVAPAAKKQQQVDEEGEMDGSDIEDVDEFDLEPEDCLFCNNSADSVDENLKHMRLSHGFCIPDCEYLVNLEGFLRHLCDKVGKYFMCLKCNDSGKCFLSAEAAKMHMVDKGHCMVDFSEYAALEYQNFYDYRPSYPDYDPNDPDKEILPPKPAVSIVDGELVSKDGTVAVNRHLAFYYKQNFKPEDDRESVVANKEQHALVLAKGSSRGYDNKLVKMTPQERKALDRTEKQRQKRSDHADVKMGNKNNKLQGRFFRLQVNF